MAVNNSSTNSNSRRAPSTAVSNSNTNNSNHRAPFMEANSNTAGSNSNMEVDSNGRAEEEAV